MFLFNNHEFLNFNDTFYYSKFIEPEFFKDIQIEIKVKPQKDSFMIIEYIEKNPINLNGYGMSMVLNDYSRNMSNNPNILVNDMNDLPMLINIESNDKIKIQETNLISSVLVEDKIEDGELFVLFFSDDFENCTLIKPDFIFLSGHVQPKFEVETTFPKQENIIFSKERKMLEDKVLKYVQKSKFSNNKELNKINIIQLQSIRTLQVSKEVEKMQQFLKNLLETNKFIDENNILVILYVISCFPIHTNEMIAILKKIENFLNNLVFTESVNYFNCFDESKLGKNLFIIKFSKIFRMYFEESELENLDSRLSEYIKEFNKKNKEKDTDSNIIKKKKNFILTKKKILQYVYYVEYKYISNKNSNDFNKELFYKYIDTYLSPNITPIVEQLNAEFIGQFSKEYQENEKDFSYEPTNENLKIIKNNILFNSLIEKKEKNKFKKLKNSDTRRKKIKYSKIFSEESPYALKIHPILKDKLSNPYQVFLNFGKMPGKKSKKKRKIEFKKVKGMPKKKKRKNTN